MIDWLSFRVSKFGSCFSLPYSGHIESVDSKGVVEWQKSKSLSVDGSYSSRVFVRDEGHSIFVSGNLVKFFQGHNLFGVDSVRPLVSAFFRVLQSKFFIIFPSDFLHAVDAGHYRLLRVDATAMFSLPSRSAVREWIRAASVSVRGRYQGVSNYDSQSLYVGLRSTHNMLKIYCKGDEFEKHWRQLKLKNNLPIYEDLLSYCDAALRVELQVNSRDLRARFIDHPVAWDFNYDELPLTYRLINEKISRLNFSFNYLSADIIGDFMKRLNKKSQIVYQAWLSGFDLRSYYSKSQFYYHRSKILSAVGIDIAIPNSEQSVTAIKSVPLIQYLIAQPMAVPDWALGTEYFFDPHSNKI